MSSYSFDASWEGERQRLAMIEAWLDPHSIRVFEEHRVQRGWRCLDVGAGGGSVSQWLCDRVGPDGSVVALDADTRFLEKLGAANLEVVRADVEQEDSDAAFDLVHSRFLLQHLPERDRVPRSWRGAWPGGLLLVLDRRHTASAAQQVERFDRFGLAILQAVHSGWDLTWAPAFQRLLALGLEDVRAHSFREFVKDPWIHGLVTVRALTGSASSCSPPAGSTRPRSTRRSPCSAIPRARS
jgi:precorrin-6B methylase 2